jgi:hypothetical protein
MRGHAEGDRSRDLESSVREWYQISGFRSGAGVGVVCEL